MYRPEVPDGYRIEPGSLEIIDEAAACLRAIAVAETGHTGVSAETLHALWTMPGFDVATDVVLVRDSRGALVGLETTGGRAPFVMMYSFGGVRPEHTGRGLGTALIEWAAHRAGQFGTMAAPDLEVTHEIGYPAHHGASADLVANAGYTVNRYHNTMVREFSQDPLDSPVFPPGITVRAVQPGMDDEAAALAAEEAFLDHFGHVPSGPEAAVERYRHWINHADADPSLFWLAWDGETVAGHVWTWPVGDTDPEFGHVGSLGVRRPWRGRGLGRALLLHALAEFQRRGMKGAELEVDADSLTGATRLYESVGMRVRIVYASAVRILRSGRSLATVTIDDS